MQQVDTLGAVRPSEEGLNLARRQGEAFGLTLTHMRQDIVQSGNEKRAGEYLISYAVEKAEGLYHPVGDGELEWREPKNANAHIEIVVRDRSDGRFLPGVVVWVKVTAETGQPIGTHVHPLVWHPYLYHYGRNWTLPHSGTFDLSVQIEPPRFARRDRESGLRFLHGATCEFPGVPIDVGRK